MSYRIVKVTSFYRDYLSDYYRRKPFIVNESYDNQLIDIMKEGFAWADFFSKHLINLGNEAYEIVRNAEPLQMAWAKENNTKADNVLLNQLKKLKPDVIFLQDTINYTKEFIDTIRKEISSVKLIIAHVCSPHSHEQLDLFKSFDIILVCSPGFQNYFNRNGIKNYLFYHGFEHSLLPEIQNNNDFVQNEILFIGSFFQSKTFHDSRLKLVESMLQEGLPLAIYSEIKRQSLFDLKLIQMTFLSVKFLRILSLNKIIRNISPLRKASLINEIPKRHVFSDKFISHLNNEAIFGIEMLKLLSRSKICLNNHGGIAGEYAANFRLFEVTGVGSLLLTDHKSNINDLFIPDTEIVTYRSESECISKSRWLLDNPSECRKIAKAGQQKTLGSHTLEKRVGLLNEIILKELALTS